MNRKGWVQRTRLWATRETVSNTTGSRLEQRMTTGKAREGHSQSCEVRMGDIKSDWGEKRGLADVDGQRVSARRRSGVTVVVRRDGAFPKSQGERLTHRDAGTAQSGLVQGSTTAGPAAAYGVVYSRGNPWTNTLPWTRPTAPGLPDEYRQLQRFTVAVR